MRVGCRILRSALASIWRMRSRVTLKLPAHFFERAAVAVDQAEALLEHLALALGQASRARP